MEPPGFERGPDCCRREAEASARRTAIRSGYIGALREKVPEYEPRKQQALAAAAWASVHALDRHEFEVSLEGRSEPELGVDDDNAVPGKRRELCIDAGRSIACPEALQDLGAPARRHAPREQPLSAPLGRRHWLSVQG